MLTILKSISELPVNLKIMKLSKIMHVTAVIIGFGGIIVFASAVLGGSDNQVFGITKIDALLCAAILLLIAIWFKIALIHHIMLKDHRETL